MLLFIFCNRPLYITMSPWHNLMNYFLASTLILTLWIPIELQMFWGLSTLLFAICRYLFHSITIAGILIFFLSVFTFSGLCWNSIMPYHGSIVTLPHKIASPVYLSTLWCLLKCTMPLWIYFETINCVIRRPTHFPDEGHGASSAIYQWSEDRVRENIKTSASIISRQLNSLHIQFFTMCEH